MKRKSSAMQYHSKQMLAYPVVSARSSSIPPRFVQSSRIAICLLLLVLSTLLWSSCGLNTNKGSSPHTDKGVQPIQAPIRGLRVYNVAFDISDNGSLAYYHEARVVIADWIDRAVTANSAGWVVYISLIGSNGFSDTSTKLIISVPATPTDAPAANLLPTPTPSGDPYKDAQTTKAIAATNTSRTQAYQQTLQSNHAKLAHIQAYVHDQTNKLRTLEPGQDASSTSDVYGFLARCSQRTAGKAGESYVFVVSTLHNTTPLPGHPVSLRGASVQFLWVATTDENTDTATTQSWRSLLQHMSASSVTFLDAARTRVLPDPFAPFLQ